MACSVSLEFRLGLGNRDLIQSIAETRDVGLRTLGSELPTKRTGEGVLQSLCCTLSPFLSAGKLLMKAAGIGKGKSLEGRTGGR